MSRWSEREIARKLAERGDELEPPPGLLEKIKSEIPPMIPVGTGVPEIDRSPSMPPRQRWLIAASVVLMIGAGGLLTLHRMEVAPVEETARTAASLRAPARRQGPTLSAPAVPPPAAQRSLAQPLAQYGGAPAPKPLTKKEEEKLKSLGYVGSGVPGSAEGGVEGGVVGGVPGAAPAAPPVAAPAPPAEDQAEKVTVTAESPLLDERREKQVDRINVGGNESGQQSQYAGPGTANQPQAAPAPRALAKTAGANLGWTAPSPLIVTIKPDAGTASYDEVRRSLAAGKLPDPAAIRVGEILNAFDTGDAPLVEGASTPFVHGPQYRLLRINTSGISPVRVSFSDSAVVRYRLIGSGVSALYEIELRPGEPRRDAVVAVLHLGTGGTAVTLSQLTSSWDQASPGFRLSALAAEFAEVLKGSPVDTSALHRLSAEIGGLPKGPKVSELEEMVERAGRIQGER